MKKKLFYNNLSESIILNQYLKKLNYKKDGTYNFENDASYIKLKKLKKLVVTTDSISENIDFFKNDDPRSIAHKIIKINLSDLSAMGATAFTYTLNLFIPNYIDKIWLKIFTKELNRLQKKYNIYLLGGDISKSKQLSLTATFFGYSKNNLIVEQNKININDDIWVTGNIGDSFIGLEILKNKLILNDKKLKKYFTNKYYYPKPCLIGSQISMIIKSMKDISDGLFGDLNKMLFNKYGAKLNLSKIPLSNNLKIITKKFNINLNKIINSGDDYQLIIISNKKNSSKLLKIAKKNKIKISKIGVITKKLGLIDDSDETIDIPSEFDHFR